MSEPKIEYIGDGVYVLIPYGNTIELRANDAYNPSDTIVLEQRELKALIAFAKQNGVING